MNSFTNNANKALSFSEFCDQCRERLEISLRAEFANQLASQQDHTQLLAAMQYSLLNGGKRVRPILVYASAQAIVGTPSPMHLKNLDFIASSLESLHVYSLIHDDLPAMDDDDLRRGKPTCHKAFNEATAILAGDALQTLAFEFITQTQLDTSIQIQLIKQLAKASGKEGMVLGQAIDLAAVNHQLNLSELEFMHRHKTGALIRASVTMGATAMGASLEQQNALEKYAAAIGLAFQVQDDILDVIADTATLGKQQGADIARNKPTYVALLGLDGAKQKLQQLYDESLNAIADFSRDADYLRQLARYIIERNH